MREMSVTEQRYKAVLAVIGGLLQFWVGNELVKTVVRTSKGNVRKLHADGTAPRRR